MPIAQSLLPEFDHEMATTRSLLERVPEASGAWKPHPKSTSLGDLASHMVSLSGWASAILTLPELDLSPPDGSGFSNPTFATNAALLQQFDENVRGARASIAATSDEDMMVDWSLKYAGNTLFSMPRIAVLRSFMMNHVIHHRGQLSVYLRLNEVPLPSIYGPTADS
jgi:uncharacterized damage-inducible protein DinB